GIMNHCPGICGNVEAEGKPWCRRGGPRNKQSGSEACEGADHRQKAHKEQSRVRQNQRGASNGPEQRKDEGGARDQRIAEQKLLWVQVNRQDAELYGPQESRVSPH